MRVVDAYIANAGTSFSAGILRGMTKAAAAAGVDPDDLMLLIKEAQLARPAAYNQTPRPAVKPRPMAPVPTIAPPAQLKPGQRPNAFQVEQNQQARAADRLAQSYIDNTEPARLAAWTSRKQDIQRVMIPGPFTGMMAPAYGSAQEKQIAPYKPLAHADVRNNQELLREEWKRLNSTEATNAIRKIVPTKVRRSLPVMGKLLKYSGPFGLSRWFRTPGQNAQAWSDVAEAWNNVGTGDLENIPAPTSPQVASRYGGVPGISAPSITPILERGSGMELTMPVGGNASMPKIPVHSRYMGQMPDGRTIEMPYARSMAGDRTRGRLVPIPAPPPSALSNLKQTMGGLWDRIRNSIQDGSIAPTA